MIKNLIFDCGGVVFNVDYERSYNEFRKLTTNPTFFDTISIFNFKHIASEFETGRQTTEQFLLDIRQKLNLNATDKQIIEAWNAMLLDFIPLSIEIIKKLKSKFKIALFSNTNQIHYDYFHHICEPLLNEFDFVYFSHKIGYKKPDPDSYRYVLTTSKFYPEETLFIDDSIENIQAAFELGINTLHYTKEWNLHNLYDYLDKL